MKPLLLRSSLGPSMTDFVTFKRMQGYDYTASARTLGQFDRFLVDRQYDLKLLSHEILDRYICSTAGLTPHSRVSRLSPVRGFSSYLHTLEPDSYVLNEYGFAVPSVVRFYLYTSEEIAALLNAAGQLRPARSPRSHCLCFLIGLLYSTGLRINEALSLNLAQVDFNCRTLFVRKGKFGKDRYVVVHPTTTERLRKWLRIRRNFASTAQSAPLLINAAGQRLPYTDVRHAFRQLIATCAIGVGARCRPRLHDLRHTYASNCLARWRDQGLDVDTMLPILATALGHVNIQATQIYVHVTLEQLHEAARRVRIFRNAKQEK